MQRVLVGGISGSGKTTLARAIAVRRGLSFVELDALAHGPGWTRRPTMDDEVAAIAAGQSWVFDSHGWASLASCSGLVLTPSSGWTTRDGW